MLQASDTVFTAGERVHVKQRHDGREREEVCESDGGRDLHNEKTKLDSAQERMDIFVPLLSNSMEEYHKTCPKVAVLLPVD